MFRKINIINMKVAKHLISLFLILFCTTINSFGVEKGYRDTGKTFLTLTLILRVRCYYSDCQGGKIF